MHHTEEGQKNILEDTPVIVEENRAGNVARVFFESEGRSSDMQTVETIYMAKIGETVIGAVKRCREEGVLVLRTMQVAEAWRGQKKVGPALLRAFTKKLAEPCYLIARPNLERFYNAGGFRRIAPSEAPTFLQERLRDTQQEYDNKNYFLMLREI